MKAMIMAAGVGNRLMPLTSNLPKPMVPIVNVPVMEYGVALLKSHGINDIVANLHYLPEKISDYFGNGEKFGVNFKFTYEKELLGTAGGVKNNADFLKDDTFVILSGDALTDIDLTKLIEFHKSKGALATIALKQVVEVSQYGVVIRDNNEKIVAFQEKPKPEEALSNLVNTGIYVFEPEIFDLIPENEFYDFGKELFPKLVEMNLPFYGFDCSGSYWCDVGNTKVYIEANRHMLNNEVKTTIKSKAISDDAQIGENVNFKGQVIIGKGCKIEKDVTIEDSIVWSGVTIGKESAIIRSVLGNNANIFEESMVQESIITGKAE